MKQTRALLCILLFTMNSVCLAQFYPQNYFRSPLGIPMRLVANFGEIRPNHWHMGLDIRTNRRVNLPVYAAAEGYISRVSIEPGGFGQAIYIKHPNGYTTVYGHLNSFFPALAIYVKKQQYLMSSWQMNINLPEGLFPVKKGEQIALSGSTGASEGPHVHFEIRNSETGNNLNPLLFGFPIADNVAPLLLKLAVYDRNKTTYGGPMQVYGIKKRGPGYSLASGNDIKTSSNKLVFSIGAVDYFNHSNNPNGIYSARILMDDVPISEFVLDNISYDNTRYINAQVDFPYKYNGGGYLQHLFPLPGEKSGVYHNLKGDGMIHLTDRAKHNVTIVVSDANKNIARLFFTIQYDPDVPKIYQPESMDRLVPNNVTIFEKENFELFTTERSIYDTVPIVYHVAIQEEQNSVSPVYSFLDPSIPVHDSIVVRIKPSVDIPKEWQDRVVIKNISGSKTFVQKATWQKTWASAAFRQFGTYQIFIDKEPPTINPPGPGEVIDLSRHTRIVLSPRDNFNTIRDFRAELDGRWICFTNDKGHSWIYQFDEHFPKGEHELKVSVQDEAGNQTIKKWRVRR